MRTNSPFLSRQTLSVSQRNADTNPSAVFPSLYSTQLAKLKLLSTSGYTSFIVVNDTSQKKKMIILYMDK